MVPRLKCAMPCRSCYLFWVFCISFLSLASGALLGYFPLTIHNSIQSWGSGPTVETLSAVIWNEAGGTMASQTSNGQVGSCHSEMQRAFPLFTHIQFPLSPAWEWFQSPQPPKLWVPIWLVPSHEQEKTWYASLWVKTFKGQYTITHLSSLLLRWPLTFQIAELQPAQVPDGRDLTSWTTDM